jgi:tetratricopeptide (TPR) repeat protein
MSRRGKNRAHPAASLKPRRLPGASRETALKRTGLELWGLRLSVLTGVPIVAFILLELILRLGGFGYPTAFLLPGSQDGKQTLVQNNQFGWRFFGPHMSRLPRPISISRNKTAGVIRIFVFGESAAYGDPQPAFGLPRMLEAQLSLRHPGVQFEVVNAAMTGINSHTILPIARDCSRAEGDIWVIYMGNNEVVGPFGAGTVFGSQVPPLPIIRANLALKTWRTGQLLDWSRQLIQKPPPEKSEWGGMLMFLNQQVRADDSRMTTVYRHFQRNLEDILRAGENRGCGIVLSTVAVNLKDCAPFASAHRPGLSEDEMRRWNQFYQAGVAAQRANQIHTAVEQFQEAASVDKDFAALAFRQGQCASALGHDSEAQAHFIAARDLDTLRFRCDRPLNEAIRDTAARHQQARVLLADAERAFASQSEAGLPGQEFFYEHVHLTFAGNYLLARTIAAQLEKLLPAPAAGASLQAPWPSLEDCARRLGWNPIESRAAFNEMAERLTDPPFTDQLNHNAQIARLAALANERSGANPAAESAEAMKKCDEASKASPDDPVLLEELATLKQSAGDLSGATAALRHSLELLPSNSEAWGKLGLLLVQQQSFLAAEAAFRREFDLDSQDVSALQNLAMCRVKQNQLDGAVREYRRALKIKPRFGPAWLGLGQALESIGRKDEALTCFQKALANRVHRASDLSTLARFCLTRGWYEAAATNYSDAIKLAPFDATLNYEAGQSYGMLGRHSEAAQCYAKAAALAPGWAQAQFQCGVQLGQSGRPEEASQRFKAAIELMPELLEARLNLGIALTNQKKYREALDEFQEVLRRSPTNAVAAKYVKSLRQAAPPP